MANPQAFHAWGFLFAPVFTAFFANFTAFSGKLDKI